MKQQTVCILFGGMSPEHEVSLRSAECILNNIDREKYHVVPVGITRAGQWLYYAGTDYRELPAQTWQDHPDNRPAAISPVRGQGLLIFEGDSVVRQHIDVVFPVLHGENGEDGSVQGLLQLAGIAYVGPHVAASAIAMDKSMTKLVADRAGVRQAGWELVTDAAFAHHPEELLDRLEAHFAYPVFVKPAGTGSSVGVSKAKDRAALQAALVEALRFDRKVLVEEFIDGHEVEVAVLGNDTPVASVCGEIDAGARLLQLRRKISFRAIQDPDPCPHQRRGRRAGPGDGGAGLSGHWLPGAEPGGFLCHLPGRRGRLQRNQYDPGLHVDLHVPEAL